MFVSMIVIKFVVKIYNNICEKVHYLAKFQSESKSDFFIYIFQGISDIYIFQTVTFKNSLFLGPSTLVVSVQTLISLQTTPL